MLKNSLTPYLLISFLIHAGAVLGMHRFLNLPDADVEAETLIPVEIVVLREPSSVSEPGLAAVDRMPTEEGLYTRTQLSTGVALTQLTEASADPIPLAGDLQPKVSIDPVGMLTVAAQNQKGPPAAISADMALSGVSPLHKTMVAKLIATTAPAAKESVAEPQLTVNNAPALSVTVMAPRLIESAGASAITDYPGSAPLIADADPLPPSGSMEPDIKPAAVLWEAKRKPSLHLPKMPLKSGAASADALSTGRAIFELRSPPMEVFDEPGMMVATFQLNSYPSGAQVFVDDMPSGETPVDMELPVGKHEFRLVLPDHYDWKAQIELTDRNEPYPIFFRLLPVE